MYALCFFERSGICFVRVRICCIKYIKYDFTILWGKWIKAQFVDYYF